MRRYLCLNLVLTCLACQSPGETAFDAERPWRQPGDVIDSILPMEEYERRFREGLPEVTALSGGAPSRQLLAERFLVAVEARDSIALHRMMVDRAEFAWLVFPHHLYRRPPYELDPATFWMQVTQGSAKGMARVLERHGGQPLRLRGLRCTRDTTQIVSGEVAMWSDCVLAYQAGDSILTRRLFGSLVEQDGRVKFLGYANDF